MSLRWTVTGSLSLLSVALALVTACRRTETPGKGAYGACAHVTYDDYSLHAEILSRFPSLGLGFLRTGITPTKCRKKGVRGWYFQRVDDVLSCAKSNGVEVLMQVATGGLACPWREPELWADFIRSSVRHCRGRVKYWEIWNEPNSSSKINPPTPEAYAEVLRTTSALIRAEDPKAVILTAGFSNIPIDYITRVYAAGTRDSFDVMNVHPYSTWERSWQPNPEGFTEDGIAELRKVMERFGDAGKPIWITETGWATPGRMAFRHADKIRAGIGELVGRREAPLRVLVADNACDRRPEDGPVPFADALRKVIPTGSEVTWCTCDALRVSITNGFDVVFLTPFNVFYPADAEDALLDFVAKGGILVETGGKPFGRPYGNATDGGRRMRARLKAAAQGTNMLEVVRGPGKGGTVVGRWNELEGLDCPVAITESDQARFLPRMALLSMQCGVEKFLFYRLDSHDYDQNRHHWGVYHSDFTEKPVVASWRAFVKMRPARAIPDGGRWRDAERGLYFPSWRNPDGTCGGAIWCARGRTSFPSVAPQNAVYYDHKGEVLKGSPADATEDVVYWRTPFE